MGNCCKTASSEEWGGEDWGSLTLKRDTKRKMRISRKVFDEVKLNTEKLIVSDSLSASSCDDANGRIKIKIRKSELEVLLGKTGKVVSAEQVLVRLTKARKINKYNHRRPWRPVLDSVPEVN